MTVPTRKSDPLQPLVAALDLYLTALPDAADLDAALRSAVKAVIPGRQQRGNVDALVETARKAFVRTLRRRARQ